MYYISHDVIRHTRDPRLVIKMIDGRLSRSRVVILALRRIGFGKIKWIILPLSLRREDKIISLNRITLLLRQGGDAHTRTHTHTVFQLAQH